MTAPAPLPGDRTDEDRAAGVHCQECGKEGPDVAEATIAGERMDLCRLCLPKLQAMCWPGA